MSGVEVEDVRDWGWGCQRLRLRVSEVGVEGVWGWGWGHPRLRLRMSGVEDEDVWDWGWGCLGLRLRVSEIEVEDVWDWGWPASFSMWAQTYCPNCWSHVCSQGEQQRAECSLGPCQVRRRCSWLRLWCLALRLGWREQSWWYSGKIESVIWLLGQWGQQRTWECVD